MKRAASVVVIVFVAFFALIGSISYGMNGKIKTTESSSTEKIQLTFINSWGGYDSKASCLDSLLEEFDKENSDISVTNKSIAGDDFLPYIKEQFRTGEQPDVFGLWPGSDIRALIAAGKVADITSLLNEDAEWKSSFDDSAWPLVEQNGKIYGVPVEMTYEGLFINQDLFKKYNAVIPRDYNDIKEDIKIFRANGIIPIAYNTTPEGSYLYQNIAMSLGGKNLETPFKDGKVTEAFIKAMYVMRDLYDVGAFPDKNECFSMESSIRDSLFIDEKAAMIVQGSWFTAKCKGKNVDLIAFPKMSDQSTNTMMYGPGCGTFYISEKAYTDPAKKEASIKLLKFLSSRSASVQLAQQTDMVSNVDISSYNVTYDDLTQTGIEMIKNADVLVGPPDSYVNRSVWESVIVKGFPSMLTNKISPEELWVNAIKAGADKDR